MFNDVVKYIENCDVYQRTKRRPTDTAQLGHIADPLNTKPLEFWSIDLQGPFRTSENGNRYIIVAIDFITKYVQAKCVPDSSSVTTANFILEHIILRYGVPHAMTVLTDQGSNFESKIIRELCQINSIRKLRSSPCHPSGNGLFLLNCFVWLYIDIYIYIFFNDFIFERAFNLAAM